jgi:uncharacterized membrane protein YccC
MTPDDRSSEQPLDHLDALTPAQVRRFKLWRAMSDLARAQEDGRLSPEQIRLLGSLAENLQSLAAQLSQLAELGQQMAQLVDPDRAPAGSASHAPASLATDSAEG